MTATIAVVPLMLYQVSLQPGAAIVKWSFEAGEDRAPSPGMTTAATVTVHVGIALPVPGNADARLDVYRPPAGAGGPAPVILWIHGGGYIANSSWMIHAYATRLAQAGYVVASLDYSLAPGSRYPTPIKQANAALLYLRQHAREFSGDPDRFVLGGDSAGAQIASQVAVTQTDPVFAAQVGIDPALSGSWLRAVVLFCGLYDMQTVAGTRFPALRTFLWAYTGQRHWESFPRLAELSTTRTATDTYPPAFIAVGDADPFEPQGYELVAALHRHGIDVTTQFWPPGTGLGHEYQFDLRTPQARTTLSNLLTFLGTHATSR